MADSFSRNKMQWLNGVIYSSRLNAMHCRVAYVLADHLNRATGDCWLSHVTIGRKLHVSTKTIQRSLGALQRAGFIGIRYAKANPRKQRFVPSFLFAPDEASDMGVPLSGQNASSSVDPDVHQSFLKNLHKSNLSRQPQYSGLGSYHHRNNKLGNRGQLELEVARRIGPDGFEVLNRLAEVDDRIVLRLCEAQANGSLTFADLSAARLAAKQIG